MANSRVCSIDGCGKPHKSKGCCKAHYMRLKRHGDPIGGRTPEGEPLRFIRDVAMHHTGDECLTWPFAKSGPGYGRVLADGKKVVVSRYVCELVNGPPPTPEHEAAHSCGKGHEGCIAPEHLSWKTQVENDADKLEHGTRPRGERHGNAKLTETAVREILALKGSESQSRLAAMFGVAQTTISGIQAGLSWAWLSETSPALISSVEFSGLYRNCS